MRLHILIVTSGILDSDQSPASAVMGDTPRRYKPAQLGLCS